MAAKGTTKGNGRGGDARQRLLEAAVTAFAERGFPGRPPATSPPPQG